jgi:hypothetical protein
LLVVPRQCIEAEVKITARQLGKQKQQSVEAGKPQPWITVSRETTFITQPLDGKGYVDYLAALNQKASEGVTVDNNAAVLFVRAGFGLREFNWAGRDRFCKMLGIEPLPEQGPYYKEVGRLNTKEAADFDNSLIEPWSAHNFPRFVEWLQSNEKPLQLVIEGTRRPRCYFPWVKTAESEPMVDASPPALEACRAFSRALVARAMLRLNQGKIAEAQQDLLACHRLGRLVGSMPSLVAALVGIAIDRAACQGDAALMQHGKLGAADALAYQRKLRTLPPLSVMADQLDYAERLAMLDALSVGVRAKQSEAMGAKGLFEMSNGVLSTSN